MILSDPVCVLPADVQKSARFPDLNLCESVSRISESRVRYVNFDSQHMRK